MDIDQPTIDRVNMINYANLSDGLSVVPSPIVIQPTFETGNSCSETETYNAEPQRHILPGPEDPNSATDEILQHQNRAISENPSTPHACHQVYASEVPARAKAFCANINGFLKKLNTPGEDISTTVFQHKPASDKDDSFQCKYCWEKFSTAWHRDGHQVHHMRKKNSMIKILEFHRNIVQEENTPSENVTSDNRLTVENEPIDIGSCNESQESEDVTVKQENNEFIEQIQSQIDGNEQGKAVSNFVTLSDSEQDEPVMHSKRLHDQISEQTQSIIDKENKPTIFKCRYCVRHFSTAKLCDSHEVSEQMKYATDQERKRNKSTTFQCRHCVKHFSTVKLRDSHENFHALMKSMNISEDLLIPNRDITQQNVQLKPVDPKGIRIIEIPKSFPCTYCNLHFPSLVSRNQHEHSHTSSVAAREEVQGKKKVISVEGIKFIHDFTNSPSKDTNQQINTSKGNVTSGNRWTITNKPTSVSRECSGSQGNKVQEDDLPTDNYIQLVKPLSYGQEMEDEESVSNHGGASTVLQRISETASKQQESENEQRQENMSGRQNSSKLLQCRHCTKKFRSVARRDFHEELHTSSEKQHYQIQYPKTLSDDSGKLCQCSYCRRTFSTVFQRDCHMIVSHGEKNMINVKSLTFVHNFSSKDTNQQKTTPSGNITQNQNRWNVTNKPKTDSHGCSESIDDSVHKDNKPTGNSLEQFKPQTDGKEREDRERECSVQSVSNYDEGPTLSERIHNKQRQAYLCGDKESGEMFKCKHCQNKFETINQRDIHERFHFKPIRKPVKIIELGKYVSKHLSSEDTNRQKNVDSAALSVQKFPDSENKTEDDVVNISENDAAVSLPRLETIHDIEISTKLEDIENESDEISIKPENIENGSDGESVTLEDAENEFTSNGKSTKPEDMKNESESDEPAAHLVSDQQVSEQTQSVSDKERKENKPTIFRCKNYVKHFSTAKLRDSHENLHGLMKTMKLSEAVHNLLFPNKDTTQPGPRLLPCRYCNLQFANLVLRDLHEKSHNSGVARDDFHAKKKMISVERIKFIHDFRNIPSKDTNQQINTSRGNSTPENRWKITNKPTSINKPTIDSHGSSESQGDKVQEDNMLTGSSFEQIKPGSEGKKMEDGERDCSGRSMSNHGGAPTLLKRTNQTVRKQLESEERCKQRSEYISSDAESEEMSKCRHCPNKFQTIIERDFHEGFHFKKSEERKPTKTGLRIKIIELNKDVSENLPSEDTNQQKNVDGTALSVQKVSGSENKAKDDIVNIGDNDVAVSLPRLETIDDISKSTELENCENESENKTEDDIFNINENYAAVSLPRPETVGHIDGFATTEDIDNESDGRSIKLEDIENECDGRSIKLEDIENECDGRSIKLEDIENESDGRSIKLEDFENESDGRSIKVEDIENESDGISIKLKDIENNFESNGESIKLEDVENESESDRESATFKDGGKDAESDGESTKLEDIENDSKSDGKSTKLEVTENDSETDRESTKHEDIEKDSESNPCIVSEPVSVSRNNNESIKVEMKTESTVRKGNSDLQVFKYRCKYCNKMFFEVYNSKKSLASSQARMILHETQCRNSLRCDICNIVFSSKFILEKHKKRHKSNSFKCQYCDETFPTRRSALMHESKHTRIKRFRCEKCSLEYKTQEDLNKHLAGHSLDSAYLFNCKHCSEVFSNKFTAFRHELGHKNKSTRLQCEFCDRKFNAEISLYRHMQLIHVGVKNHACLTCGEKFALAQSLRQHMRVHTGERPYKCDFCDKSFVSRSGLTDHLFVHTDDRPWRCDLCGKTFKVRQKLNRHFSVHSDHRPWKCNLCDKAYKHKGKLNDHVHSKHGQNVRPKAQVKRSDERLKAKRSDEEDEFFAEEEHSNVSDVDSDDVMTSEVPARERLSRNAKEKSFLKRKTRFKENPSRKRPKLLKEKDGESDQSADSGSEEECDSDADPGWQPNVLDHSD